MDIDSILSQFGEKTIKSGSQKFDVDSLLSQFETKTTTPEVKAVDSSEAKPPRPEDFAKSTFADVPKTRRSLPTTNIEDSIVDAFKSGRETFSSGLSDIASNKPASGVGKVGLGALATVMSPATGLIEGGVVTPVTDITGSKRIGETAGAIVGLGLPVGRATKAAIASLPKNKALSTLVESIGKENLPDVVAQMKANPRLAPADLSPRVLQDTQHLFANEGPQIDYLAKTSGERMATRKGTIEAAYDASAGTPVNVVQKLNELATASKKVGNDLINPALAKAKPVELSNTLTEIDNVLKPGVLKIGESVPLTEVKRELGNIQKSLRTSKEYDANDLHKFQSGLRRTAESLLKSADSGDRQVGRALMNVRNNLVNDIEKSAPGYKAGLNAYKDEMHIADAFRYGAEDVFSGSKKMENRPEFTKQKFDSFIDAEKEAAREGTRTAIGTEIGIAKNGALAGESLTRSDFNQEKLKIILGEAEANKLIKALNDERAIANTHNKIVEGSQTAMRTASKSQFAMPTKSDVMGTMVPPAILEGAGMLTSGTPGIATGIYAATRIGFAAKDAIKMKLAREHNARYAQYALPTEGPSRDALIQALEARIPGPKQSLLRRGATGLARIVSP